MKLLMYGKKNKKLLFKGIFMVLFRKNQKKTGTTEIRQLEVKKTYSLGLN